MGTQTQGGLVAQGPPHVPLTQMVTSSGYM
jgi:hypothetical protein